MKKYFQTCLALVLLSGTSSQGAAEEPSLLKMSNRGLEEAGWNEILTLVASYEPLLALHRSSQALKGDIFATIATAEVLGCVPSEVWQVPEVRLHDACITSDAEFIVSVSPERLAKYDLTTRERVLLYTMNGTGYNITLNQNSTHMLVDSVGARYTLFDIESPDPLQIFENYIYVYSCKDPEEEWLCGVQLWGYYRKIDANTGRPGAIKERLSYGQNHFALCDSFGREKHRVENVIKHELISCPYGHAYVTHEENEYFLHRITYPENQRFAPYIETLSLPFQNMDPSSLIIKNDLLIYSYTLDSSPRCFATIYCLSSFRHLGTITIPTHYEDTYFCLAKNYVGVVNPNKELYIFSLDGCSNIFRLGLACDGRILDIGYNPVTEQWYAATNLGEMVTWNVPSQNVIQKELWKYLNSQMLSEQAQLILLLRDLENIHPEERFLSWIPDMTPLAKLATEALRRQSLTDNHMRNKSQTLLSQMNEISNTLSSFTSTPQGLLALVLLQRKYNLEDILAPILNPIFTGQNLGQDLVQEVYDAWHAYMETQGPTT